MIVTPSATRIPRDALGVGLRPKHYAELAAGVAEVNFLEVICENFMGRTRLPKDHLRKLAAHYPVVGHGVALNVMGSEPLDIDYLQQLKDLVAEFELPFFTCHLCWTGWNGHHHHDLLPVPFRKELVNYVADRAAAIQDWLGIPVGLENVSSYVSWRDDDLTEWEFFRQVVERSATWYLLDINNVFVSCENQGGSEAEYFASVLWERVLQVHIAGHQELSNGLRHDTHDRHVAPEVWRCYAAAWKLGGPFPTLLEWDANIPSLHVLLNELEQARKVRAALGSRAQP